MNIFCGIEVGRMRNLFRKIFLWLGALFWSKRFRITSVIASSFALQMIACAYGTEDDVCYDSKRFLDIGMISMSKIDSAQLFLNGRRVCVGETNSDRGIIACRDSSVRNPVSRLAISGEIPDNCTPQKGAEGHWDCLEPSDYLEWKPYGDIENCEVTEEYPMWFAMNCYVGGRSDSIDVSSSKLSMNVFVGGQETKIETGLTVSGATHITIVPESDTTKWFSYSDSPVPVGDMYRFPASSSRLGCFEGYCVLSREVLQKEYCFVK